MLAKRFFYVCVGLVFFTLAGAPDMEAQTILVPFGSAGWRYLYTNDSVYPAVWSRVDFDDSGWAEGCAPFGGEPCGYGACTAWPEQFVRVVIRRRIHLVGTPTNAARMDLRLLSHASVWVNGIECCGIGTSECRTVTDQPIPGLQSGDNVLLIFAAGASLPPPGSGSKGGWLDAQVTGFGVTPTLLQSWGSVKIRYR